MDNKVKGYKVYQCNNFNNEINKCVSQLSYTFCLRCMKGIFFISWTQEIIKRSILNKYFHEVKKDDNNT